MSQPAMSPRTLRFAGSEAVGARVIADAHQGALTTLLRSVDRECASRAFVIGNLYPRTWTAGQVLALSEARGTWTVADNIATFTPADPDTFWAAWDAARYESRPLLALREALQALDAATAALDAYGRLNHRTARHLDLIEAERAAERRVVELAREI